MIEHQKTIEAKLVVLRNDGNTAQHPHAASPILIDEGASTDERQPNAIEIETSSSVSALAAADETLPMDQRGGDNVTDANAILASEDHNSECDSLFGDSDNQTCNEAQHNSLTAAVKEVNMEHHTEEDIGHGLDSSSDKQSDENGTITTETASAAQRHNAMKEHEASPVTAAATTTQSQELKKQRFVHPVSDVVNEAHLTMLLDEQVNRLTFPIGCNVWFNLHPWYEGEAFECGKVTGAAFCTLSGTYAFYYKILLQDGTTSWVDKDTVVYAPKTTVYYSPSSFAVKGDSVHGEILLCTSKTSSFCYSVSVMVGNGTNAFETIEATPSEVKSTKIVLE